MVGSKPICVGIVVDSPFANRAFVRCEEELFYCRVLRDANDTSMEGAEEDVGLQCWFSRQPYTSLYHMHGDTQWTRALEFDTSQGTAVCNPIFIEWHNLQIFAVSSEDRYRQYVSVSTLWQNWDANRMLCVR